MLFKGTPQFNVTNPLGTIHGGWYGAVLDSCMACAVMTKVPRGSIYTTLEYKVNITRALPLDTLVRAIGTVAHSGRSTAVFPSPVSTKLPSGFSKTIDCSSRRASKSPGTVVA